MKTYRNLFLVFLVSGLWHGAAMTFVIWGAIHGVLIMAEKAIRPIRKKLFIGLRMNDKSFSNKLAFASLTFFLVCFAWIFFRANSLKDAMTIIENSWVNNWDGIAYGGLFKLGLESSEFCVAVVSMIILVVFDAFHKRKSAAQWLTRQSFLFRFSVYVAIVFIILIFGVYGDMAPQDFIYFPILDAQVYHKVGDFIGGNFRPSFG